MQKKFLCFEQEEEDEERDEVAEDEDMAEADDHEGGRAGALGLANGAGPLHDDEEEEPESAVVLHEVRLRCAASYEKTQQVGNRTGLQGVSLLCLL